MKIYTDDELLKLLSDYYHSNKLAKLSAADCNNAKDLPNASTYKTRFGSWNKAKELAGISTSNKFSQKSEEELLDSLKAFYTKNGRAPTQKECRASNNLFGPNTYKDRFGTWDNALLRAEIPKNCLRSTQVSEEHLIESLLRFHKENSRAPTHDDCNNLSEFTYLKSHMVYARRFGSFTNALLAAGLEPNDTTRSILESDIAEFIASSTDCKVLTSVRDILPSGKELDIYIPELRLAFEIDGLYWHSEALKGKDYHLDKTNEAEKLGIHLVHIFESDLASKRAITESRILNLLGKSNKVYARNCTLVDVSAKEAKEFCDINHIQGHAMGSIRLGLLYNGSLVALQTFCKSRYTKSTDYELLRYCSSLGTVVVGGASKLFSEFKNRYPTSSVVSYADRRWSIGALYKALGFTLSHCSSPNYWYFKGRKLESRVKYQKHKLPAVLQTFDESKTEKENMLDNGFNRIFDCGNMVFTYIPST